MATTKATLTITSGDLLTDPLSLTATHTMYGLAGTTGPTLTTGLKRVKPGTGLTDLITSEGKDNPAYVYIKNTDTTYTNKVQIKIQYDSTDGNVIHLMDLHGGQFCYFPYVAETGATDGVASIRSTATSADTVVEYMVIYTTNTDS